MENTVKAHLETYAQCVSINAFTDKHQTYYWEKYHSIEIPKHFDGDRIVYFLFNNDVLIYIGVTSHPYSRMRDHIRSLLFHTIMAVRFKKNENAKHIEGMCIGHFQPPQNKNHTDNDACFDYRVGYNREHRINSRPKRGRPRHR